MKRRLVRCAGAWRVLLGILVAAGPARAGTPVRGTSIAGSAAVQATTAEIMARPAPATPEKHFDPDELFIRPDWSHKEVDPAGAGLTQGPAGGSGVPSVLGPGGPLAPQTVGVNALGPVSGASPCGTPPDTMGAIGPTQFVAFVNCNIVTYNKATGAADGVLNTPPSTFFSSVKSSSFVSDPHVRYDRLTQRWFLFIIDVTFPNNRVLLAVSNTATITPSTVWSFFFFQSANGTHTSCLADYPTPGIDANALYVGVNQFCGTTLGTASYAGSDAYVIQKSSVLGAGPIKITAFQSLADFYTPQGVDNVDPAATEGWILGGSSGFWNRINLARVSNPGSLTPTVSTLSIATANQGIPATQPHLGNTGGTNGQLDAIDNRPLSATFRGGSLWTAMGVGTNVSGGVCSGTASTSGATRDAMFWWEITGIPTGSTPTIRQAGIVCDPGASNPAFYSYGTIAPNGQGHAAAGFSVAGAATFVGGGTAGRLAGDTLGTLQGINLYAPGTAAYNPSFDAGAPSGRRWGDYSYTSLDPCNDMTLWTIQEYVATANQYATRFAELKAPPPASPVSVSPSSVAAGLASVNVVVTGASAGGSGFYDTPASMASEPCRTRLAGAVSGGVTVNSVTYTDPTHVTLNVSTVGALAGSKNVTLTNPDGQAASGTGILTVAGCTPPPAPVASSNTPLCLGGNLQLSASTVAGATYAWTGPNSFSSGVQNPALPAVTAAAAGTYTVVATVAGCASAPATTTVVVNPVPATPVITAPVSAPSGGTGRVASVSSTPGSTYAWTIGNGTITSGQGTSQITFTAGAVGTLTLGVTETNAALCPSAPGSTTVGVLAPGSALSFFAVTPCRIVDTRSVSAPALAAGGPDRAFVLASACGVPAGASAVSANVAVVGPAAPGNLTFYRGDGTLPGTSTINFSTGQTRANNTLLQLALDGSGTVKVHNAAAGSVDLVLDVNGYFQ